MANKITKGFSCCTSVVGVLCLLTGIGISICAWVLGNTLPSGFRFSVIQIDGSGINNENESINVGNFWWGGIIYVVPGILGIVAGCTRNVCAMILYLIFNIICCICSSIVVVFCGLAVVSWAVVNDSLQQGVCATLLNNCVCTNLGTTITLYGASCSTFMDVEIIIGAMVAMGAMSSILSFIASYVSCCSLCNQEHEPVANIIITGGATGVYQPPPVVISNATTYQPGYPGQMPVYAPMGAPQAGYYYPPQAGNNPYANQPQIPMQYPTNDKAKLVKNEIV